MPSIPFQKLMQILIFVFFFLGFNMFNSFLFRLYYVYIFFSHIFHFREQEDELDDLIWHWKEVEDNNEETVEDEIIPPDCEGMTATNPLFSDNPLEYFSLLMTDDDLDLILTESNRK